MARLKYILCGLVLIVFFCSLLNVNADSGWGSSYSPSFNWGSSSGFGSSFSWGGSSYSGWDFSYGSSSDNSSISLKYKIIYTLVLLLIALLMPILSMIKSMLLSMNSSMVHVKQRGPITTLEDSPFLHDYDDVVGKYFPQYTEKSLIEHLFKLFVEIQEAWMNFDYDRLKELCTDQLYQSYKMDLEQLKSKHRQNIMHSYSLNAANIMGIEEENDIIIIKLFMHASFYDYVIDTDSNRIVRGYSQTFIHNQYNMEFVVTKKLLDKCPNCGNDLNGKNECDYCHSHVNDNYSDFVLSKKDNI